MAERWQTWAAIVSAVVAAVALVLSWQWNRENDKLTTRQEARLDLQEQRLNRQEVEQYASKVYLGEAPQYFYKEFPPDFHPVALHFTDPCGDWRRPMGARLDRGYQPMPPEDTGVSPYVMDVQDCSG